MKCIFLKYKPEDLLLPAIFHSVRKILSKTVLLILTESAKLFLEAEKMTNLHMLFGQFLLKEGVISRVDIFKARLIQKRNNLRIGELARGKGWLTDEDIEKILSVQEETYEKFGEIAMREKLLQQSQIDKLLKEHEDNHIFFGEALVRIGVITQEKLLEYLKKYNKLQVLDKQQSEGKSRA